jgi:hypothetical protein
MQQNQKRVNLGTLSGQIIPMLHKQHDKRISKANSIDGESGQAQIHRQKNEAPATIDTIAMGYLRTGPMKSVTLPSW